MITIIIKTVDKLKINMEDKHGFFKKIWKLKEYKEWGNFIVEWSSLNIH
jgi:hypothetical protein